MVALTIGGGGARTLHGGSTAIARLRPANSPPCWSLQFTSAYGKGIINSSSNRNASIIVAKASKKQEQLSSSRTGKFDSKNRRSTTLKEEEGEGGEQGTVDIQNVVDEINGDGIGVVSDDGKLLPELPGLEPDFWEGPQWDTFGFLIQYLWAFSILFALVACGIAVATYNEGASDFKQTPAYKESIQSRELLEEPEGSNSDVFESNPTEEAPSLE